MRVRPALATDLYLLYGLSDPADPPFVVQVAGFLSVNAWQRHQERPDNHLVILEADGEPVGAASFERVEPRVWHLAAICLFPEHRHQGLGVSAVSAICDLLETIDTDAESVFWQRHVDNEPMRIAGLKLHATELGVASGYVTVALPLD